MPVHDSYRAVTRFDSFRAVPKYDSYQGMQQVRFVSGYAFRHTDSAALSKAPSGALKYRCAAPDVFVNTSKACNRREEIAR